MAGFVEWGLDPALVAGMKRLGWNESDPLVRDVIPPVLRGGNVVVVVPPGPAWAGPALAAALSRTATASGDLLVLAAPALVGECGSLLGELAGESGRAVEIARDITVPLASRNASVIVASPATAFDLHTRSALRPDRFAALVLAWPEDWSGDAVAALLQDLPRDMQHIVLTADGDNLTGSDGVVERFARKAVVAGVGTPPPDAGALGAIRTVATSWIGRAETVAMIRNALDAPAIGIWTADNRDADLILRTVGGRGAGAAIGRRRADLAGPVVCYDLPRPEELRELCDGRDVVLLVAPGSERYVARVATDRRPWLLNSVELAQRSRDAIVRQEIVAAIGDSGDPGALYALGPLFEEHDPQLVAAGLYKLWRESTAQAATPGAAPARPARPAAGFDLGTVDPGPPAKIWIGAGKKDDATVGDFVAVLIREAGMNRSQIGRIELRDTFALVEVPAADAQKIVERLVGVTIRKRKVSARVDRGRGGGSGGGTRR